jgi:hypothetical protein
MLLATDGAATCLIAWACITGPLQAVSAGVVDLIRIGGASYNVAYLFMIGAAPLFLLPVGFLRLEAAARPSMVRACSSAPSPGASMPSSSAAMMVQPLLLGVRGGRCPG